MGTNVPIKYQKTYHDQAHVLIMFDYKTTLEINSQRRINAYHHNKSKHTCQHAIS